MAEELKPCPFCGRKVEIYGSPETKEAYYIQCDCGAFVSALSNNVKDLIKVWNTRTENTEIVVHCKDCEEFVFFKDRAMCMRNANKQFNVCTGTIDYSGLIATKENNYCSYSKRRKKEQ